jgi:thiamine biosynthesis protein ThiS
MTAAVRLVMHFSLDYERISSVEFLGNSVRIEAKPNTVVALNHRVVCSKRWKERQLQDGDRIVTFQILGGG